MTDPAPSVPPSEPSSQPPAPAPSPPLAASTPAPQPPAPEPQRVVLGYVGSRGAPAGQRPPEAHDDDRHPAAKSRWNPLATPLGWLTVLLQAGLFVVALSMSEWRVSAIDPSAVHRLGALDIWKGHTEWWRWFATTFLQGSFFNAVICVSILWSLAPALDKQLRRWRFGLLYLLGGLGAELTRLLLSAHVSAQVASNPGNGGRCAAFALLGSIAGIYLGLGAVRQALGAVISRVGYYAVLILLMALLAPRLQSSFGVGIDLWGALSDMAVGAVCGFAIALTLHRGGRRLLGFALVTIFVVAVGVEAGWLTADAHRKNPQADSGENDPEPPRGSKNNRRVDENKAVDLRPSPTPSPRTSMPDSDPPEIATIRAKAHAVLDPLGPLPGLSPDGDLRETARKLAAELTDFDNHWTGNAAANLDLEIGQLFLLDHELVAADHAADAAKAFLRSPPPKPGSPNARRLAQAYGTLGIIELEEKKTLEARDDFGRAAEADPSLPEPHFYLGKLLADPARRKLELKAFVDLVGPTPPPSQADLVPEAKELLGS